MEDCKRKKNKKKIFGKGALFLASFVQVTAVPGSGFALQLPAEAPPGSSALRGRAPASQVAAPGARVLRLHGCRETPRGTIFSAERQRWVEHHRGAPTADPLLHMAPDLPACAG